MSNERITENIVRDLLKGYDFLNKNVIIEEQKSANPSIDKYLKNASKKGSGRGYPEFIISFVNDPDKLIIIECKADIKNHESINRDRYSDYAVDGVLLYTSFLKNNFNVISIAISGQNNKELKISSFLWLKGNLNYFEIDQKFNTPKFYFELIDKKSQPFKESDLIKNAIDFNKFLHNFSIPEVERCTLISAILVALQDAPFQHSYKTFNKNEDLIDDLIKACKRTLVDSRLGIDKTNVIIDEYSKFKNNISFKSQTYFNKKTKKDEPNTILRDFITKINMDVFPYVNKTEFDIVGKFYTHFIRYAGSDKNTGLVLTPSHITDLFCDIANLSVNDIVFDECCGTGGFLVSSMNYMINLAKGDEQKIKNIKKFQLVGIEKRSDIDREKVTPYEI